VRKLGSVFTVFYGIWKTGKCPAAFPWNYVCDSKMIREATFKGTSMYMGSEEAAFLLKCGCWPSDQ
jgi:hypothetical protein